MNKEPTILTLITEGIIVGVILFFAIAVLVHIRNNHFRIIDNDVPTIQYNQKQKDFII